MAYREAKGIDFWCTIRKLSSPFCWNDLPLEKQSNVKFHSIRRAGWNTKYFDCYVIRLIRFRGDAGTTKVQKSYVAGLAAIASILPCIWQMEGVLINSVPSQPSQHSKVNKYLL